VAQAFGLAQSANKVGAPSLRSSQGRVRYRQKHGLGVLASGTHPCKVRKGGAPSVVLISRNPKGGPPARLTIYAISETLHMRRNPVTNYGKCKATPSDSLSDEVVSFQRLNLKTKTIQAKKGIGSSETGPLVSIHKGIVVRKRFHQGCGFLGQAGVVADLGTKNGGLQASLVENARRAAEFIN